MQDLGSIRLYLRALLSDWAALMSGGLSVPFVAYAAFWASADQKPPFYILAFLCLCFAAFRIWNREHRSVKELEARLEIGAESRAIDVSNVQKPELTLIIGHDGHYVETNNFNSVNIMKTVCVGVKNIGDAHLSNCKLMFEARRPKDGVPESWLRDGPFSLSVGEERYLSVAAYNEPISPQAAPENWIRTSAPPSGNYWSPPMLPAAGGAVSLIATSAESRECRMICKFWVNGGRLYWETVSGSVPAATAPDHALNEGDKFIPMPEAAAKAYGELRAVGSSWAKTADYFAQQGVREKIYFAGALGGEVPIYGKHPPSPIYEVIDPNEFKRGMFADDGATFHYHDEKNPRYVEIAVKNGDLMCAIEKMKDPKYGDQPSPHRIDNREWHRLTDADRAAMSEVLSDGRSYEIEIFCAEVRDCTDLGDDFYNFFQGLNWIVRRGQWPPPFHKPEMRRDIRIATLPDHVEGRPDIDIRERSGAVVLLKALLKIGLPAIYSATRGGVGDLVVHLIIGIKSDVSL